MDIPVERLTIRRARQLLGNKEISAVELAHATLSRLRATDESLHAYRVVLADQAIEAARRADAAPRPGPLSGIPFAVKDVFLTRDVPVTAGSASYVAEPSATEAAAVRVLRSAGAVLVGIHVAHEFALGRNEVPCRNPWDVARDSGSSSAGAGASVAVGSCMFALGTDSAGSVRNPAAFTGTVGLKPGYGRVSGAGVLPLASSPSLDHVGIVSRTAEDAALVLDVIADPRGSLRTADSLEAGITGLRLGIVDPGTFSCQPDEETARNVQAGITRLESLGAELVECELPPLTEASSASLTICVSELAARHRTLLATRPELYTDGSRDLLESGLLISGDQVGRAQSYRSALRETLRGLFASRRVDALALPTVPFPAMRLDEFDPARHLPQIIQYSSPWSLVGLPALSVPCGLTADGLPVGLQLVGGGSGEATILRLASQYQQAGAVLIPPLHALGAR